MCRATGRIFDIDFKSFKTIIVKEVFVVAAVVRAVASAAVGLLGGFTRYGVSVFQKYIHPVQHAGKH